MSQMLRYLHVRAALLAAVVSSCAFSSVAAQSCDLNGKKITYRNAGAPTSANVTLSIVGSKVLLHEEDAGEPGYGWVYFIGKSIDALADPIEKPGLDSYIKQAGGQYTYAKLVLGASWDGNVLKLTENKVTAHHGGQRIHSMFEIIISINRCQTCTGRWADTSIIEGVAHRNVNGSAFAYCHIK